jgi:GH25 family lysozyme M1 (1,4-beta-N-acetylmuramidase)
MLTGPDCSRHQGDVDWRAVAAAGHSFAIIKATEGTSYGYTGWWYQNAREVEAAGLTLGAYHFLRAGNGADQARYFVKTVDSFRGRIAVLDVEKAANGTYPGMREVVAFVTEFRRLTGDHPLVIYTGGWFWKGYLDNPHGADLGPLWHSEYETSAGEVADGPEGDRYGGWDGCTLWQWTSSGSCPGVAGRCDLNILRRGTLAALTGSHKAGSGPAPTPTTPNVQEDDMAAFARRRGDRKVYLIEAGERVYINSEAALKEIADERPDIRHAGRNANGIPQALEWETWHVDIYTPRRGALDE